MRPSGLRPHEKLVMLRSSKSFINISPISSSPQHLLPAANLLRRPEGSKLLQECHAAEDAVPDAQARSWGCKRWVIGLLDCRYRAIQHDANE